MENMLATNILLFLFSASDNQNCFFVFIFIYFFRQLKALKVKVREKLLSCVNIYNKKSILTWSERQEALIFQCPTKTFIFCFFLFPQPKNMNL